MRTGSLGWLRSTVRSAVMIFVRLAIGSTRSGRWRHSTSPVSTSNTSPARGGLFRWTWKASIPESGTAALAVPERQERRGGDADRRRENGENRDQPPDPGAPAAALEDQPRNGRRAGGLRKRASRSPGSAQAPFASPVPS